MSSLRGSPRGSRSRGVGPTIYSRPLDDISMRNSASSSSSASASVQGESSLGYRNVDLCSASVFVDGIALEQCPQYIKNIVEQFKLNLASETARIMTRESSSPLSPTEIALRDSAAVLAVDVANCIPFQQPAWMQVNHRILAIFTDDESLFSTENQRLGVPVGPVSQSGLWLSAPVPDIIIGLALEQDPAFDLPISQAPTLSQKFLTEIIRLCNIQPFVATDFTALAFPCLIWEAKSAQGSFLAAENQAAHAAAKALAMAQTLRDSYLQTPGARASPRLPVIVICSEGAKYEVLIAFDVQREELPLQQRPVAVGNSQRSAVIPGVHLRRFWLGAGDELETMYQFLLLLQKIKRWILDTWKPAIVGMLDAVKADLIAQNAEEERANVE